MHTKPTLQVPNNAKLVLREATAIVRGQRGEDLYASDNISEDGITMGREFTGETENGNAYAGRWVVRQHGVFIDIDTYRNDLAERHNFSFKD